MGATAREDRDCARARRGYRHHPALVVADLVSGLDGRPIGAELSDEDADRWPRRDGAAVRRQARPDSACLQKRGYVAGCAYRSSAASSAYATSAAAADRSPLVTSAPSTTR